MITVQSWIQDLWTIYERKKKTSLNQIMPIGITSFQLKEQLQEFLNWSVAKIWLKRQNSHKRRQSLIMGSNGTETILSIYLGV